MWVIIRYTHFTAVQINEAVAMTDDDLKNFMNTSLETYQDAKIVMIPQNHMNKKMIPILTSEKYDFYAQWFDV